MSNSLIFEADSDIILIHRILLATIRNFGLCPCPRCLIPKDKIPDVGKVYDDRRRNTTSRIDSAARNFDIDTARKFIYENGEGVKSAAVERVLRDKSLVPTTVRPKLFSHLSPINLLFFLIIECFFFTVAFRIQLVQDACT